MKQGPFSILEKLFEASRDDEKAVPMKAYLKDLFDCYGIATKERRSMYLPVIKHYLDASREEFEKYIRELYASPMRDMHQAAIHYAELYIKKHTDKAHISTIEYLIVHNSWWDTVDMVASHTLGIYLDKFPEETKKVTDRFEASGNMWLIRSCILFQLKYKQKTNKELLFGFCERHRHSNEFFIQKAIGWALREYGKTNPDNVLKFVKSTQLKPLSKKEALRIILSGD